VTHDNQEYIEIRGARENNLKNISLRIPKRKITIFTGVSGSGKSSIVFDTIANEARRQLNETFGTFIRSLLPRYPQPDADSIENPSMAISPRCWRFRERSRRYSRRHWARQRPLRANHGCPLGLW
jgi:excinuclease UvrABC ATPase subunit